MKKKSNGALKKDDASAATLFTREEMRRGVMGKYYRQTIAGRRTITLASDVAKVFRTEAEVNEARRVARHQVQVSRQTDLRRRLAVTGSRRARRAASQEKANHKGRQDPGFSHDRTPRWNKSCQWIRASGAGYHNRQ